MFSATVKDESSNDKTNKSPRDSTLQETRKHDVAVGSNGNVHSPQSQENVPGQVFVIIVSGNHKSFFMHFCLRQFCKYYE